jgi:hypothetical protein
MIKVDNWYRLAVWLFILAVIAVTIYRHGTPATVAADAPATEFASARAIRHIPQIAREPHPVDSPAHDAVRDYIINELRQMGFAPEVQAISPHEITPSTVLQSDLQNIMARLGGSQPGGKAVMLVAHYDSVSESSGACDDGAGVATLLESARALKAGPPLQRDVIFLFTDGEEEVLLGAKGFVGWHPAAEEVGLVLNFEARGCKGPVFMFETSEENGWLIREFGRVAPYPLANSLMSDIYTQLNLTTDLRVFKREGIPGLNFAFVEDAMSHHSPLDSPARLDEGSVQHHGSYAMALTRHFANTDLVDLRATNAVYFDILGMGLVSYPQTWALPLAAAASVIFLVILIFGLVRKRLKISGVVLGFLALLTSLAVSYVVATFIWEAMRALHPDYTRFSHYKLYLLALSAIALAITSAVYLLLNRRWATLDLYVGGLLLWAILTVFVGVSRPYASYVFLWPFVFGVAGALFVLWQGDRVFSVPQWLAVLCLCAVPGLILLTNTIYIIALGIGLSRPGLLVALAVLLFGLLVPHICLTSAPRRWLMPVVVLLAGIALLIVGNMMPGA